MRKLQLLKALIDLFYFFAIIATAGMLIVVPILLFNPGTIDIKIKGQLIEPTNQATQFLLVFAAAGGLCFIYAIHLLRKTVGHFQKREIFHPMVILNLNRMGIFIIASSLLTSIPLFFYNMIERNHLGLQIGADFDSLILSVSLGLFFMVLSEVFKIALRFKEENELTV